jgi:hypothetical protein
MNLLTVIVLLPLAGFLLNGTLAIASAGRSSPSSAADCRSSPSCATVRMFGHLQARRRRRLHPDRLYVGELGNHTFDVGFYSIR